MKIHKEGTKIIILFFVGLVLIDFPIYYYLTSSSQLWWIGAILHLGALIFFILVVRFFRVPVRTPEMPLDDKTILCPADGKVVVIEDTEESELLHEKRIQVSIFMSPLNVHVNWFPVSGKINYEKYHSGRFLVAWHPKSSELNERNTVAVQKGDGKTILFRQIAGAVARRIISYAQVGDQANAGEDFGFIKFGSRVDVFLPLDAEIHVSVDQQVKGVETKLATLR